MRAYDDGIFDKIFSEMTDIDDYNRFDREGGYPSDTYITNEYYIMASIYENEPTLEIWDVKFFKKEVASILKAWKLHSYDEVEALNDEDKEDFFEQIASIKNIFEMEK